MGTINTTLSLKKINIILWIAAAIIFFGVVLRDMAPTGSISFQTDFSKDTPFVSLLTPEERTTLTDGGVEVSGEPVYFDIHVPRYFDSLELDFEYQNDSVPIIELGKNVGSESVFAFDLQPLESMVIDELEWNYIEEEGIRLYQAADEFTSIERFKNFLPDSNTIATYNAELPTTFTIPNYSPSDEFMSISTPLIGSYSFLTYIQQEDLNISFDFNSLDSEIRVYSAETLIHEVKNESSVVLKDLPDGVYRVEVLRPAEDVTSAIQTTQQKIAFIDSVRIGQDVDVSLYTSIAGGRVIAYDPEGLQGIIVDEQLVEIDAPYSVVELPYLPGEKTISIPQGNILIAGEGMISFSRDAFFDPQPKVVSATTRVVDEGIRFIYTDYVAPTTEDDYKRAHSTIPLEGASIQNGDLRMVLSLKGIQKDSAPVIIHSMSGTLKGQSLSFKSAYTFVRDYIKFIYLQYVRT